MMDYSKILFAGKMPGAIPLLGFIKMRLNPRNASQHEQKQAAAV